MKEKAIDAAEFKRRLIQMLKKFDSICIENDIKYSVGFGTLIGAIRHHGIIPWDDDIDIIITRDNYTKLCSVFDKNNNIIQDLKLLDVSREKKYSAPLPKIIDTTTVLKQHNHAEKMDLGIYMDIFVYDKIPEKQKNKIISQYIFLQKIWTICEMKYPKEGKNFIKKAIKFILNQGFAHRIALRMDKYAKELSNKNQSSHLYYNLQYRIKPFQKIDDYLESDINDLMRVDFEGYKVYAIKSYDKILTKLYGDYMKLPPENKRISHHDYEVWEKL